jgi:hypothetical protein
MVEASTCVGSKTDGNLCVDLLFQWYVHLSQFALSCILYGGGHSQLSLKEEASLMFCYTVYMYSAMHV